MLSLRNRCRVPTAVLAALAACLLGTAGESAAATIFGVTDGGVTDAVGCTAASCGGSQTFADDVGGFAAVSGSITIDTTGGTLDLSLTLEDAFGLVATGGPDNGVSAIGFSDVLYSASDLSLTLAAGSYVIDGGQTASVSGSYSQDAGAGQAFPLADARITGTCDVVGDSVTCGFSFGTTGFTLDVGAPPASRYFRHTMNVTAVVPEPSTGLLVAAGLAGLALRRRAS